MIGIALHKSTDGTSMINYAQWRPQADFDTHLAQFSQNASHIDPHTLRGRLSLNTQAVD